MSGFKLQTTISSLVKKGTGGGGVDERKSKDAYRKEKDLEEERKLGLAPACVDVDTGRDINPHIPHFITQTPWYVPTDGPTLKHQRPHWERQQNPDATVEDWYKRGVQEKPAATKFRKGACENCGSMTHKKKDCFERPRKLGAKITGNDIAPDEFVQPTLKMSFEGKRDRWNGYNPATYSEVIKEHEKQEEVRKIIKADKLKEEQGKGDGEGEEAREGEEGATSSTAAHDEDDEDKYADDMAMESSVDMDSRTRITVRNLRIREDTAKYLYNLNENAPYYDPKSRSMRENPLQGVKGKEAQAAKFAGENFVRYTGEVVDANEAQVFAWSARCQGIDVHALAEPTKLEALQKEFRKETKDVKQETKHNLLEKYGGAEHLQAPPKELLLAQTESYVEYSRKGNVIKGEERPKIKSQYEEDEFPGNHSSVFGSYWAYGKWGFKCCHSFVKKSYCIGEQGYAVNDEMADAIAKQAAFKVPAVPASSAPKKEDDVKKEKNKDKDSSSSSSEDSDSESESSSESEDSEEERAKEQKKRKEAEEETKRREERSVKKREKRKLKRMRRSEKLGGKRKRKRHNSSSSESSSDDSEDEAAASSEDDTEDAKLQKAVQKAQREDRRARKEAKRDERARKYNSSYETKKPSDIDMEAYKITTVHSSDPMAAYFNEKREKDSK